MAKMNYNLIKGKDKLKGFNTHTCYFLALSNDKEYKQKLSINEYN